MHRVGCHRDHQFALSGIIHESLSRVKAQLVAVLIRNRLTNTFSKKLENLDDSVALHFFVCNFITRHMTLRMPPALKAHVTDHVRTFEELVDLIDRAE